MIHHTVIPSPAALIIVYPEKRYSYSKSKLIHQRRWWCLVPAMGRINFSTPPSP